jgi:hypothetical protein
VRHRGDRDCAVRSALPITGGCCHGGAGPAGMCSPPSIHGDETTVTVLGESEDAHGTAYARDNRPFGGKAAPAAVHLYSPNRGGKSGIEAAAGGTLDEVTVVG